ncbi:MAG: phosphoadenosine phosphosulfate reductase family protein [Opitutaceae bacterium]
MNPFDQQMAIGRFHRCTPAFARALGFATAGVCALLEAAPRCYVSLSFGKQSICLAHLVWSIAPATPMHFLASEETWMLYDYERVIAEFTDRFPIALTIHQTHRISGADTWKHARDAGDQDLQQMCPRAEWDGWFWGLATEESPMRRATLLAGYGQDTPHPSIFRYRDGRLRGCPLMHWGVDDLAAYIARHDLPLLNIYRRFGLQQRTTARVTKKMLRNQGMAICRMTNSSGFRRLVNRFPEVNVQ